MHAKDRQRGMTKIAMLAIAVVVLIVGIMVIRLFPVYYKSYVVSSVFSEVEKSEIGSSPREIRDAIMRRFIVNDIDNVPVDSIKIKQDDDGGYDVSVSYKRSVPFVGNLSVVAKFEKHADIPGDRH